MIEHPDFKMPSQMTVRLGPAYWSEDEIEVKIVETFNEMCAEALKDYRNKEYDTTYTFDFN